MACRPALTVPYKPGIMGSTLALIATLARGFDKSGHPDKGDELLADLRQGVDELIQARAAIAKARGEAATQLPSPRT